MSNKKKNAMNETLDKELENVSGGKVNVGDIVEGGAKAIGAGAAELGKGADKIWNKEVGGTTIGEKITDKVIDKAINKFF